MSAGYGRGYYGDGQLAHGPQRKRSWFTIAAVLGVGATAAWLLWPRKVHPIFIPVDKEPTRPMSSASPLVVINTTSAPLATPAPFGGLLKQLEDDARAGGFLSVKDYEDSVVATAKQLQATGAKVILAPHLQHLASQLGS